MYCRKGENDKDVTKLLKCGRCNKYKNPDPAYYCSVECQKSHWPTHKMECKKLAPEIKAAAALNENKKDWAAKYRRTEDGSLHFGRLELCTWNGVSEGEEIGWGGTLVEEVEDLQNKFRSWGGKVEDPYANINALKKLVDYWDNAFRWTCCGLSPGEGVHGCDHHGHREARKPCGCDYCRAGEPLPEKLWQKKLKKYSAQGLKLLRGPDPRS
ncbi:unnamed protein product, partial [Heterosigma akashiwo]